MLPDDPSTVVVAVVVAVVIVLATLKWQSGSISSAAVQKILCGRRSVVKYNGAAPDAAVQRALKAAIHAPNHFINEPWRFRQLGPQTKDKITALNTDKKDVFDQVPGWLFVTIAKEDGQAGAWAKLQLEDHAACSCAVMNFMLSLASEGLGSKWMTGALQIPPEDLMKAVGADSKKEHFMGVVWFGKPATPILEMPAPKRKTGLASPVLTQMA